MRIENYYGTVSELLVVGYWNTGFGPQTVRVSVSRVLEN